jgi:hypothetical protein
MLRTMINLNEGVDITKFPSVIRYLRRKREGYIIRSPDIRTVSVIFYLNWSNVHQNFDFSFECTLNLVINKLLLSNRKKLGYKLVFQIILFNAI